MGTGKKLTVTFTRLSQPLAEAARRVRVPVGLASSKVWPSSVRELPLQMVVSKLPMGTGKKLTVTFTKLSQPLADSVLDIKEPPALSASKTLPSNISAAPSQRTVSMLLLARGIKLMFTVTILSQPSTEGEAETKLLPLLAVLKTCPSNVMLLPMQMLVSIEPGTASKKDKSTTSKLSQPLTDCPLNKISS